MKPQRFNSVVVALLIAVLVIGLSWFMRTKPAVAPEKMATATMSAKVAAPIAAMPPARVELPKAAAVPARGETAASKAEDVAIVQAELKSTMHDMAKILREKGMYSFILNYYPPEFAEGQSADDMQTRLRQEAVDAQDPQWQQILELQAKQYDYLATSTPVLNARGDQATYYYPTPDNSGPGQDDSDSIEAKMIKIDGKWHLYTVPGDDPAKPFPP